MCLMSITIYVDLQVIYNRLPFVLNYEICYDMALFYFYKCENISIGPHYYSVYMFAIYSVQQVFMLLN